MAHRLGRGRWLHLGGIGAAALGLAGACSATDSPRERDPDGQGASGLGGGGISSGGTGFGGTGANGGCNPTCAADLKTILDCNGNVVKVCPDEQACAGGQCVNDACEAANASKSSYGCDYWAIKTELIGEGMGACFAAFVANTWTAPVHIDVEHMGQSLPVQEFIRIPKGQGKALTYEPYDPVAGLPPGEVGIVFLSQGNKPAFSFMPDCPAPPAVKVEAQVTGTGRGQAFHIRTDQPVVAYQILPYGGGASAATSATLLLPTSAWDTNYIAVNAYKKSQIVADAVPILELLAYEDGTEVTILPIAAVEGGPGVLGGPANQPITYQLAAGEFVQLSQAAELTGSPITSNKPIGVWGGASCLNIPVDVAACDSAHQQIPPIKALGHEYAAVRHRGRNGVDEAPPWRIVGAVDGTELTWEPAPPAGAPTTVNRGQLHEFQAKGPFVVRSQGEANPFYVSAHMTGGDPFGGEGDPEWVNVIPVAQYLSKYVLFTDPTYSETELVLVRRPSTSDGQFKDVTLDCAGLVTGWTPFGPFEYARVPLVTGNFEDVNGCSNGRHEIWSEVPFGVTVWGWGTIPGVPGQPDLFTQYVSYAYPAGASVQPINEVYVPTVPK